MLFEGFTPNNPKMTQSYRVSQPFIGKNVFYKRKPVLSWNKTLDQHFGA